MRPLCQIAAEIQANWKPIYYGAKPYLEAMLTLNSINDMYFCDSGHTIVSYFLSNAATWRGDLAKKIKKELKDLLNTRQ